MVESLVNYKLINANYIKQFEHYLLYEQRLSDNTIIAYKFDLKLLTNFIHKYNFSIEHLNKKVLVVFLASLHKKQYADRTIARVIGTLKIFYRFLHERHGIHNAADALIYPKPSFTLPIFFSDDEIKLLISKSQEDKTPIGQRNHVIINLLYATGMRVSELCNLKLKSIDFNKGFIRVMGKGSKERYIPLPAATLDLLRTYIKEIYMYVIFPYNELPGYESYLFPRVYRGTPLSIKRQAVWRLVRNLSQELNMNRAVYPHAIRHSLATYLFRNGASLRMIQILLGHENLNTVEIYTHLDFKNLRSIYDMKHPRA